MGSVHTCPDIFKSATFSFPIRLPSTNISSEFGSESGYFLNPLASSGRSVGWGAVRKNRAQKNKKCAVRGSERTPVGKLNKRSFRVYHDLVYPLTGQF